MVGPLETRFYNRFTHIEAIDQKVMEYIINEEEAQQAVLGILYLVNQTDFCSFERAQHLRFTAASLQIKFQSYLEDNSKSVHGKKNEIQGNFEMSYKKITEILTKCVDECLSQDEMSPAVQEIFYKAIGLLLSITFDPAKYNFMNEDTDETIKVSNHYYEQLKEKLNGNLQVKIFNYLTEMINYCPKRMYELISEWRMQVCDYNLLSNT